MSLAEDLVTAAAQAICQTYDKSVTEASLPVIHATHRDEWTPEARAAVVAVLKRLAAKPDGYLRSQEDGGITYTRTLRELVEDIEGGDRG